MSKIHPEKSKPKPKRPSSIKPGDDRWNVSHESLAVPNQKKWKDLTTLEKVNKVLFGIIRLLVLLIIIFTFICTLALLSDSFQLIGGRGLGNTIKSSAVIKNPVSASIIGMIITLILQSSSTLISILVGMIAGELLTVHQAIPIMFGAEMGASIMNALISLTQSGDRSQFRRAFAAATMNDIYNFLCYLVFLPIEIIFAPVERLSALVVSPLSHIKASELKTLNALTDPLLDLIIQIDSDAIRAAALQNGTSSSSSKNETFVRRCINLETREELTFCPYNHIFAHSTWSDTWIGLTLLAVSLGLLVICLLVIVKIMQDLLAGKIAVLLRKLMDKKLPYPFGWLTNYLVMCVGATIVVIVQSSSVFRSALTPLVGIGVVTLEKFYPLILGGNVGTTFTGTLAALSADASQLQETLQMALAQTIYNLFGILAFYPIPFLRHLPIQLAMKLGDKTAKYRWFALVYIAVVFFIVPAILLGISFLPHVAMIIVLGAIILFFAVVITINVMQVKCPRILCPFFRNWNFLPIWARSLQPYDKFMVRHLSKLPFCKNRFGKAQPETPTTTNDIENVNFDGNNNQNNNAENQPTEKLIRLSLQTQV